MKSCKEEDNKSKIGGFSEKNGTNMRSKMVAGELLLERCRGVGPIFVKRILFGIFRVALDTTQDEKKN